MRGSAAVTVNRAAVLGPFVNDDTFAVAYIDVGSLNAKNLGVLFASLPKLPDQEQAEMLGFTMVSGWVKSFQDAGGQGAYVLAGLGDIHIHGGPLLIATTRPGKHPEDVEKMIRETIRQLMHDPSQTAAGPIVQRKGDVVLVATKSTVARYAELNSSARNDLIDPLARLSGEGAVAAAVFCPGLDFRRVVRELWPELPGPLASLRGELADRWLDLEVAIDLPPNPRLRIAMQAKDAGAAVTFAKLVRDFPAIISELETLTNSQKSVIAAAVESLEPGSDAAKAGSPQQAVKQLLESIVEIAPPQQNGARVTMTLATDEQHAAKLRQALTRAIELAQGSHEHREKLQQFHNLALGLLNFESARSRLPASAIYDKDGHPLLSWRVAVLPYLGEVALYRQFHLDEPWDSPHNRTLIAKMPKIFADPDPKVRNVIGEGKTTYQAPVGQETVFHSNEGTQYREITDGTSNTILLMEVEPLRAVVWTKPEDWEVDMAHPRRGLEANGRKQFVTAWCDSSVQEIPANIDEATLRAYLTRAGREVVKRP